MLGYGIAKLKTKKPIQSDYLNSEDGLFKFYSNPTLKYFKDE